jgi:hypothetical protein
MSTSMFKLLGACVVSIGTILCSCSAGHVDKTATLVQELKSIGKIGPQAIELNIWTGKRKGAAFSDGESIQFHLKASQEAYVAAVYVSRKGEVIVLFPNRESRDGAIPAKREHILFGPGSTINLKVSKKIREAHIFFYVFSKGIDFGPLKLADGKACIRIPQSSEKDLQVLVNSLKRMARDKGFNRTVVVVKTAGKADAVQLMGLPRSVESEQPTPVTGAQGFKDDGVKPGRE